MNIRRPPLRFPLAAVVSGWLGIAACVAVMLVFDYRLDQAGAGSADLYQLRSADLFYVAPVLSAAVVGSALGLRRPRHPVGWLFLGLAFAMTASGVLDGYTAYGAVAQPGSLPAAGFVAAAADASFIPWLMLLAFILLLTPSGHLLTKPARLAALAALVGGVVSLSVHLLEPYRGDHRALGTIENPLALDSIAGPLGAVGTVALITLHAGLLAGPAMVILRFRSARGAARRQLRWLALAAIPFPILVVGAYIAATLDNQVALGLAAGGFVAVIPFAAALAIERDHLYDIDRLLSRGLTYSLLTAGLVGCYAIVVLFIGQALGEFGGNSEVPAVVATLVTASVALPARRYLQEALDRRFNRRQFEAISTIRRFVREPSPSTTIEQALRDALRDQQVAVAYWVDERECWVDEKGLPVLPDPAAIALSRREATIAAVGFDSTRNERRTVEAAVAEALPEIENARLRAAIALQLVEVRESRARIVAAQLAERRRIERNLHDGAQQRLLAIGLQLRAAQASKEPGGMHAAMDDAVQQMQLAVRDLRDLANGLHPSFLADGGLAAALDDLAARSPVVIHLDATAERFAAPVEETAWFIVCEAVTNAVKHASPAVIEISACGRDGHLRLTVEDDGCGGADPFGNGLRGIADRAEAAGGRLSIRERPTGGTIVTAELPCAL